MDESISRFHGVIVPMVTPLVGRDELDVEGLGRLVNHLAAGGLRGIFILGTTGEGPSLSAQLKRELVTRTVDLVGGRLVVLVGVTDTSFVESVRLAEHAKLAGADAVVVASPYYFPAGQPELIEYFRHLCPEMPLPIFLYNTPSTTKLLLTPEAVLAAAEIDNVIGLKDSYGDLPYFETIMSHFRGRQDFAVFMGEETLIAEAVTQGAAGVIPGGANVHPRLFVRLYNAARNGETEQVQQLQEELRHFQRIYAHGHHWSSVIKGLKCALSIMGICDDFAGEPFHRFRRHEHEQVERDLREIGLLEEYSLGEPT